ncbi:MAG: tetratricopeptide repeat protein, partial [Planctomycetes bacterium]|nr:tetratricopeptide repeat protein [Planctomycetota bacterium]
MKRIVPVALLLIVLFSATLRADDPDERLSAARGHLLRGQYEEAAEGYGKIQEDEKVGVAAAIGLSRCHEATGRWDAATAAVEKGLEREPGHADLLGRQAELALARGQIERAREAAQRAIEGNPDHLLARWVLVQIDDVTGNAEAASSGLGWFVRYFNAHEVKDPESLVIIGQAAAEHAQRGLKGREQAQQLGTVLNDIYDQARKTEEDLWPAWYQSGWLFLKKYKKGDALADLRRAVAINPNAAEVHMALGVAALQDYDIDGGHQHCDRALAINPNLPAARQLKADLFMAREQFTEALADLE